MSVSKVLLHSGKSRCFSFPINSREILEKHRAEAKEMSIFEYDQEKHMRQEREEVWEDGRDSKKMQHNT